MGRTKATRERAKCVSDSDSSECSAPAAEFVKGKAVTKRKKGRLSEGAVCEVEEVFLPPVSRESLLTLNPYSEIEILYRQMASNLEKAIDRAHKAGMPKKAAVEFAEVEHVASAARERLRSKRDNVAMQFTEAGQQMRVLKSKLNRLAQRIAEAEEENPKAIARISADIETEIEATFQQMRHEKEKKCFPGARAVNTVRIDKRPNEVPKGKRYRSVPVDHIGDIRGFVAFK
ncbi:UNVERIFIED_CONTAM: hypothetical protein HHA_280680 [Hammondia hammondi]|eukprot:XP_008885937.1 hypothetical protein HHA_280680 [Hammondia hammondi]